MKKVKIGVVCLARKTYDFEAAAEIYAETQKRLKARDDVDWVFVDGLVIEVDEAQKAAAYLAGQELDGVAIISGTFHLGHLAPTIKKALKCPVLLWAFNELPYNGGKIRLNSVCGLNLNASVLYKSGIDDYSCHVGDDIDEVWLNVIKMKAAVSHAHVGLAGYRADGFFNLSVEDTYLFNRTGVLVDHYELSELMNEYKMAETGFTVDEVKSIYDCSDINDAQLDKVSVLSRSMENFINKNKLDALAIRCWPEFANTFGVAPCAAMSLLQGKGYTLGCEGDIEGTLSLLACNAIAKDPAFLADLSQVNFEENYALLWHCGVAAYPLWDGKSLRSLDTYFAGGRGVTAGFVMKTGTVTVMRIDTARGKTRLFIGKGEAVPMERELSGTYAKVIFDQPISQLIDTVTETGVAHHISMIYGDYTKEMKLFARLMGFEVIE
ncbi:MAG: fucose isomerase [Ruminococcaceae bacterium]|jgi:L-fucose isomerase-like protein|nr:fucose isomerase [Oscillospiraceae bacterium]